MNMAHEFPLLQLIYINSNISTTTPLKLNSVIQFKPSSNLKYECKLTIYDFHQEEGVS